MLEPNLVNVSIPTFFKLAKGATVIKLNQQPTTLDIITREATFYKSQRPELAPLFELYLPIFELELYYLARIKPGIKKQKEDNVLKNIKEGIPLLDLPSLKIKAQLFNEILKGISEIVWQRNPNFENKLKNFLTYPDLNPQNQKELPIFLHKALNFNTQYLIEVANNLDLEVELLFFLTHHALTPFAEKASYVYRDSFDYSLWQKEICPFCGKKPAMGFYRDYGTRILQCFLCRSWWTYPPEKCVVCGNEDPDQLECFYLEEDETHLAEVCNRCKKYIKTTDCQTLNRVVDLEIEDIATIYLDIAAKEKGYTPAGRITFATRLEYI